MCNEYSVLLIGGEPVLVHRIIGGGYAIVGEEPITHKLPIEAGQSFTFKGFPDREMPVAVMGPGGGLRLEMMRWGFPPVEREGRPITNARNLNSRYWKPWLGAEWRCLVPVTEFCEWTDTLPKQKKWFKLKGDTPFMFAGLWRPWSGVRGTKSAPVEGEHKLFAFVTTEPNTLVASVHAKAQPVILKREQWYDWMTAPTEIAMEFLHPSDPDEMVDPYDKPTI